MFESLREAIYGVVANINWSGIGKRTLQVTVLVGTFLGGGLVVALLTEGIDGVRARLLPFLDRYEVWVVGPRGGLYREAWAELERGAGLADGSSRFDRTFKAADSKRSAEITFRFPDNSGDPAQIAELIEHAAARRKVLALVGPARSSVAARILPTARERGLVVLLPTATASGLLDDPGTAAGADGQAGTVFRLAPNDTLQIDLLFDTLKCLADERDVVAIIREGDNPAYQNALATGLRARLETCEAGCPKVLYDQLYDGSGELHVLMLDQATAPDFVVFVGTQANAQILHRQMVALGLQSTFLLTDGSVVGSEGWDLFEASRATFLHAYGGAQAAPESPGSPSRDEAPSFFALGYDAMCLLDSAVQAIIDDPGAELSRESLARRLGDNDTPVECLAYDYVFDSAGENINGRFYLYRPNAALDGWERDHSSDEGTADCSNGDR